jgi:NAD-dependent deacetylase
MDHIQSGVSDNEEISLLRRLIGAARNLVALTGAGISTESGVPDFRSPGGIWTQMQPITFQDFMASEEMRLEDWRRRFRMNESFSNAEPNPGHYGIVRLADEGKLTTLITQNIDSLHQRSGFPSARLVEIHGNVTKGRCLQCRMPMPLEAARKVIETTGTSPRCSCGGLVKAAIISFGERMPEAEMRRACAAAAAADLFLVAGSSLQVRPAASLPVIAKRSGARLVILNRGATPLDGLADLVVADSIGGAFSNLYPQLAR